MTYRESGATRYEAVLVDWRSPDQDEPVEAYYQIVLHGHYGTRTIGYLYGTIQANSFVDWLTKRNASAASYTRNDASMMGSASR